MPIRSVLKMGNPRLFEKSSPVTEFETPELYAIIEDLKDTMHHYNGVGIAGPQIGYHQQIMVFGFESNPRYPNEKPVPETILINPTITLLTDETNEYWEGCLSVPGLRGLITRVTSIHYSGFTPEGKQIKHEAHGFHARVVQHEYDHLEGILFPQRLTDFRKFGFEEELNAKVGISNDVV